MGEGINVEKYILNRDASLVDAMKVIDTNRGEAVYIVNENSELVGSLTDGDIRRWILKTGRLDVTAGEIMHCNVSYLTTYTSEDEESYMITKNISSAPIVDENMRVIDIVFNPNSVSIGQDTSNELQGIDIIIMAGGKGTRLYPYTKILPKPLIPIGDIPIIERIINRFCLYGANRFYVSLNYKKGMIKSYFDDLNKSYDIIYVEEDEPLGTAGSLKLINQTLSNPIIVTNCDILIDAAYDEIIRYHKRSHNDMTIVSSLKNTPIPYGVIHSKEHGLVSYMEEKPQITCMINTGMYILDSEYINRIPKGEVYHMTNLADLLIKEGKKVGMYPISEDSFLDMGQFEELKNMEERIGNKE